MLPNILNIAHRGARSVAPENTIYAARKAIELGADMMELDVGVTADHELILFHDDKLTRTTNAESLFPNRAPWTFTTFTLAELKQLDTGSRYIETDPYGLIADGTVTEAEQVAMRNEPIPTLRDLLCFVRDQSWRVNIEIKLLPPPFEAFPVLDKVLPLITELDMAEQVVISSFMLPVIERLKRLNPAITAAANLGYPRAEPIIWPTMDIAAVHPRYTLITPDDIQTMRQAGFGVNPWTVNDKQDMERLIQAGVTGLITDFPQTLATLTSKTG